MHHAPRLIRLLVVVGLVAPPVAPSQIIEGRLSDAETGRPIPHAFVVLRDSTDSEALRVLTDPQGLFVLHAPGPGTYRLQTAIIGWQRWTSPSFELTAGQTFTYRVSVPLRAVRLDAILIEGERECRLLPDSGRAVAQVWDEARKALQAVAYTADSGRLWYHAINYDRQLHPVTLEALGGSARQRTGQTLASPFVSLPAAELSRTGYVRRNDAGEWEHFGPDADVLLSQSFANDHCFQLRAHPEDTALIGLGFEPIRSRDLPDIAGVLWLDRTTARLQFLDFEYHKLPWPVATSHAGGHVAFEEIPGGLWIVSEWRLRLPELLRRRRGASLGLYRITGYQETGGHVVQLRNADGTPLTRTAAPPDPMTAVEMEDTSAGTAEALVGLRGTIRDLDTGQPLPNAALVLRDDQEVVRALAVSDSMGTFLALVSRSGSYRAFVHRDGYRPTTSAVLQISDGELLSTRVNLKPSALDDLPMAGTTRRDYDVTPQIRYREADLRTDRARSIFDLAILISGVRSLGSLSQPTLALNEHRCAPSVFVDGYPSSTSQVLHVPLGAWVGEVEISLSEADTPSDYRSADPAVARCGTILVWTAEG